MDCLARSISGSKRWTRIICWLAHRARSGSPTAASWPTVSGAPRNASSRARSKPARRAISKYLRVSRTRIAAWPERRLAGGSRAAQATPAHLSSTCRRSNSRTCRRRCCRQSSRFERTWVRRRLGAALARDPPYRTARLGARQLKRQPQPVLYYNLRPKSADYRGMKVDFVSFVTRNRYRPPVAQPHFQAWAHMLGSPIAARNNPAWLFRIPDVATQLMVGGSPRVSTARPGPPLHRLREGFARTLEPGGCTADSPAQPPGRRGSGQAGELRIRTGTPPTLSLLRQGPPLRPQAGGEGQTSARTESADMFARSNRWCSRWRRRRRF